MVGVKLGMDTKYLKTVLAYFLTAVCAVVLVFYFFYHLSMALPRYRNPDSVVGVGE